LHHVCGETLDFHHNGTKFAPQNITFLPSFNHALASVCGLHGNFCVAVGWGEQFAGGANAHISESRYEAPNFVGTSQSALQTSLEYSGDSPMHTSFGVILQGNQCVNSPHLSRLDFDGSKILQEQITA
jgi:hypothetical protein